MPLSAGDQLGPYEILARIGAGGMGEVWKARDPRLNRIVAIKQSSERFHQRFQQEARAIAALNHPNICQIYDVGPDYLVMEFVDGPPLAGPLALEKALPLARQIAAALEAAHAQGITHRDLKPSNILASPSGPKLLDFGLAKITRDTNADATATQTQIGTVLGTAAYMSPEQAAGKPADARSDIFSFGAVLYELLAGRRAFQGETQVTTMAAVLHTEPEPLTPPTSLAAIATRCLRKSPADRYQTAAHLSAALAAVDVTAAETPSIAVLPFTNMSADKENEYFSDGLSEEIINLLVKIPGLRVIARTSAFHFRGEHDLRKVGQALQVAHVLEGSVRKSGDRLRITAQLIQVADNSHLWSERYDRRLTDVFEIQDEIAAAIVDQLKLSLGAQPAPKRPTQNIQAYEAVLEGRHHWAQFNPASAARARACFERAIDLDADYADAHANLATYFAQAASMGLADPRLILPKGRAAVERALQLDPDSGTAHSVLGAILAFFHSDWTAVERHFRQALRLAPSEPFCHLSYTAWYLYPRGRIAEADPHVKRALELDPLSPALLAGQARQLFLTGKIEACEAACRRILDLAPYHVLALYNLAASQASLGRFDEAAETARQAIAVHGRSPFPLTALGIVHAMAGQKEEARAVLAEMEQQRTRAYGPASVLAWIYACLGEPDAAFAWANRAIDESDPQMVAMRAFPYFEPLRGDPRYTALLARMNLA